MKRKKKIPIERHGIEVRYAYEGGKEHKVITVSSIKMNKNNEVTERDTVKEFHPNAKKKALDAAIALNMVSSRCDVLVIDENLMRDEYLHISQNPMIIREAE